jgi:hypothetical protein
MAIRSIRSAFTRLGDQIESERYLDRVREQIYFEGGPLLTGGKVGAIDYDHFRGNPDRWNLQQRPSESYHFKTRVFAPPLEFTTQPYNGSLERVIVRAGRETFFQATEIAGLYMFTNKLVIMCNDRAFEVEKWVGVTPDKRQEHPWIEMLRKLEGDRTKEPTMHEIADAEKLYGSLFDNRLNRTAASTNSAIWRTSFTSSACSSSTNCRNQTCGNSDRYSRNETTGVNSFKPFSL